MMDRRVAGTRTWSAPPCSCHGRCRRSSSRCCGASCSTALPASSTRVCEPCGWDAADMVCGCDGGMAAADPGRRVEDDAVRRHAAARRTAEHRPLAVRSRAHRRRRVARASSPTSRCRCLEAGAAGRVHLPRARRLSRVRSGVCDDGGGPGTATEPIALYTFSRAAADASVRLRIGAVGDRVRRQLSCSRSRASRSSAATPCSSGRHDADASWPGAWHGAARRAGALAAVLDGGRPPSLPRRGCSRRPRSIPRRPGARSLPCAVRRTRTSGRRSATRSSSPAARPCCRVALERCARTRWRGCRFADGARCSRSCWPCRCFRRSRSCRRCTCCCADCG